VGTIEREPNPKKELQMRNTTFISSMVLSVACVSAANADYVLQAFSGSASASVAISRANRVGQDGFALNYNAIAGGKSTMDVALYGEILGNTKTTNSNNPTTALNKGTYGNPTQVGNPPSQWFNEYYGRYTGSGATSAAVENYRAWSSTASFGANLQNAGLNLSSDAQYDTGVADWTKVRYTSAARTTVRDYVVNYRSDADQAGNQGGTSLMYDAVAGQSMDLSASTGFTGIELKGSGVAWATEGEVRITFSQLGGGYTFVNFQVGQNQLLGDFTATKADLLSFNQDFDFSQVSSIAIDFYAQGFVNNQDGASGGFFPASSGITGNNNGFSYNASQVNLLGYAPVPAPGALALLGAAGLIGARRRRA
jgi:hypothetical protein